jgi:hypothetical protein
MDFPEVWHFKVKQQESKPVSYESNEAVAVKLTSKLPIVRMVADQRWKFEEIR